MAYLINRNTSGLLPCLHGITRYIVAAFGDNPFSIQDLKFDKNSAYNIHQFSPCAVKYRNSSIITCRYLENPHSRSRCGLVASVDYDPQKSKLASDVMNALDGLALVTRDGHTATITELGKIFSAAPYESPEWLELANEAVLSYGPFVGMLYQSMKHEHKNKINRNQLKLGFPRTDDEVLVRGRKVVLSTGSQADTSVRTRSVLLSYAVNTGFMLPIGHTEPDIKEWQAGVYDYVMNKKWNDRTFSFYKDRMPKGKILVKRPLSYENLTKSTRSLRERGQALVRQATMDAEEKVRNRRLAILFLLSHASQLSRRINIPRTIELMSTHDHFVVSKKKFSEVMISELGIAQVAGVPFVVQDQEYLEPLTIADSNVLTRGASKKVMNSLHQISAAAAIYG